MSLLLALLALAGGGPGQGLEVEDFACLDHTGAFQRLSRHFDAELVVLYVFAEGCAVVREDAPELAALQEGFAKRGVHFLGLDPAGDERPRVADAARELGLAFPILMDDTQCVGEMLGVERAGEALVVSPRTWRVLWRGPLDSSGDDAGARPWLAESLEALLSGGTPPAGAPLPEGRAIEYREPRGGVAPDYARDVAPILAQRCASCHHDGGIGPWSMKDHASVRKRASMIRQVLLDRRMPPWYADPEHGDFVEDIGVTAEETRTLLHWLGRDAPRGEGEDPLAAPRDETPEWPLGEPDLVIELPEQEIPASGLVPYRKIPVKLDLPEERWVRALDLRPSNPVVLHHAFGFILGVQEMDTLLYELEELPEPFRTQAREWMAANPGATELPEYAAEYLRKRAFFGRTYFARYFPGTRSSAQREGGKRPLLDAFPAGTGKLLPANAEILFELHYTTSGKPETDRPRLGIYFHDEKPARELEVTSAFNRQVGMEPHERDKRIVAEKTFDAPIVLYGVSPHMHYRGRSMRYTAFLPDGTQRVLINVAEYVFDWQANYTLREPMPLPAGTRIVCDAVYDNSAHNEYNPNPGARVYFGPKSQDEMFVAYMVYALQ